MPPTVSGLMANQGTINEGGTITLTGTFTDPGILDTHTVSVAWGDGSDTAATVTEHDGSGTFTAMHTFLDNPPGEPDGAYTIVATATDKDGGQGSASIQETVDNVPPTVSDLILSQGSINEGGTITLTGDFTDPGILDTHTVSVNWGDGTSRA